MLKRSFVLILALVILSAGSRWNSYSFTDTDVVAGHTYYYQLEDVETSGTTTRHGPIEVRAEGGARTEILLAAGLIGAAMILGLLTVTVLMR